MPRSMIQSMSIAAVPVAIVHLSGVPCLMKQLNIDECARVCAPRELLYDCGCYSNHVR